MKKYLFFLFSCILATVSARADAPYDFSARATTGQTLYYRILSTSEVELTAPRGGYVSSMDLWVVDWDNYVKPTGNLIISEHVVYGNRTYTVTSIGDRAFLECSGLTSVVLPESITKIGKAAFGLCSGLATINIPNAVTIVQLSAFSSCSNLQSIIINSNVQYIGNKAFSDCIGLHTVTFNATQCAYAGDSVYGANHGAAFVGCTNLVTFTLGQNVTAIPDYLCYGLTGLTTLNIPDAVLTVGKKAFYGCNHITTATIGNGTTSVGRQCFYDCESLTTVTLGSNVSSIGDEAFYQCRQLLNVYVNRSVPPTIQNNTFYAYNSGLKFYIPCNSE